MNLLKSPCSTKNKQSNETHNNEFNNIKPTGSFMCVSPGNRSCRESQTRGKIQLTVQRNGGTMAEAVFGPEEDAGKARDDNDKGVEELIKLN